mgnify:CR=1 FL=1
MSQSSSSSTNTQTPAVRTFQMDGSTQGSLASSVNLFRGDVNLTRDLFTLPGRGEGGGLDVSIAIQYQSNVFREATTWNAEAPTGTLGLGWSLPLTWIEAIAGASPVAATRQYVFYDNGSPNLLVRQPLVPPLFTMDVTTLQDGAPLPAAVRDQLRGRGLAVSSDAVVRGFGPWTVEDPALMQSYALAVENGRLVARDGGESYQLHNYQFWKIVYYPAYERWVVVDEAGVRRSFGGRTADGEFGFATSRGNSVAWSVWWTDARGRPAWTGPSNDTVGQVQVARAWYLCEIRDRFGSAVTYSYNGGARDAWGLVPGLEQQVGLGGKPYTKAVHLDKIKDSFGRTVEFVYGEKLWSDAATAPREYHDPHRDPQLGKPTHEPGAYQDRYETRYLKRIEVNAASGARMYSFQFEYAPRPEIAGPERAVANLTSFTDRQYGDTFKRLLTAVTQRDQDGVASPGLRFTYDLGGAPGGQPGALLTVTEPQGGKARYTYRRDELPLCDRALRAARPVGVPQGAAPRVFYGDDYVAVCYYNQSSLQLSLQVYTWDGRWLVWSPDAAAVIDSQGLQLASLRVYAQADFLAVTFNRPNGDLAVYLYDRDPARPGQWRAGTVLGVVTALNRPSRLYAAQGVAVEVRAGRSFLVVARMNAGTLRGDYDVITWRWTTQQWTCSSTAVARYSWIAAGAEWFAVLDRAGNLQLSYLDGALAWQQTAPVLLPLPALATTTLTSVRMTPGAGLLAIANLTVDNAERHDYRLVTAAWNADYAITVADHGSFTDLFDPEHPLSWTPQVIDDILVAVNGNLVRRFAGGWRSNFGLSLANPPQYTEQRFVVGPDTAVRVLAPTGGAGMAVAHVVAFDPTAASWTAPAAPPVSLSQTDSRDNWPSLADGDWLIVGPYAWHRGSHVVWTDALNRAAPVDLRSLTGGAVFRSESLVDNAPGFVAFTVEQNGAQSVQAVTLRNGRVDRSSRFATEKLYLPSDDLVGGAGVSPRGPRLFASFPSQFASLNDAQSVTIRRYAGAAVDGPITHYTVVKVEMEDGFGEPIPTSFAPDLQTAAADASGDIVKFYRTAVHPGAASAAVAPYGRVVNLYLNGAADQTGANFFNMLDGLLVRAETYDAGNVLLESTRSAWTVIQQVASSPTDPSAPAVQLRGGWVARQFEETTKDGVTRTTLTGYVPTNFKLPVTGAPVMQSYSSVGGDGVPEVFRRLTRHGVELYPALWAIHAYKDVAQVDNVRIANAVQTLVASSVCTYTGWPSTAGEGVTTFAPAADFALIAGGASTFPFSTWSPGQVPSGWTPGERTTARSRHGQPTASVDATGVAVTTIYDRKGEMAIAEIANAAPPECAYYGFQSYEDKSGWNFVNERFDNSDAYAGTRSALLVAGGSASISTTIKPRRPDTWVVGCRYRTPGGFVPDASGLRVSVKLAGGQTAVVTLPWAATNNTWAYVTLPVGVPAVGVDIGDITVSASNTTASNINIDAILVAPLVTAATLRTFDPDSQQVLATSDAGGRTSRTFYDRSYRPSVSVGAAGLVREISSSFLSRRGSPTDSFDPASPNAELTLHTAAGGVLESFRDGRRWSGRWKPSVVTDWNAAGGALTHTVATTSKLTWTGTPASSTYALYFELETSDPAAAVVVTAGDVLIGWSNAGWYAQQAGVAWPRLASPPTIATRWLLVVGDGVVGFFGDGQLLFSRKTRPSGGAAASLSVTGAGKLRNLTGVTDIRLGVSYNDAGGRQRQVHQLCKDDSLICQLVFDALDRQIATTRSAPGSFGSGALAPTLAYRPGFLDVRAFLAATAGTWQMTGDVADYYRGQTDGGVTRSDDRGYPYRGARYEASPRKVKLETSLPGKDLAIDLTVPAANRKTVQFAYGPNAASGSLQAGQFAQTRTISAVKTASAQLVDNLGQQVATTFADSGGTVVNRSAATRTYAVSAAGPTASLRQQLPNAQSTGPHSGNAAYVRSVVADGLQQTTSVADPDTGTTSFIHDSTGDLRFVQPAMGAGEQWYVYYRYDAVGRLIEEGTIAGPWDPATLRQRADDRRWPPPGTPGLGVVVRTEYDGDGKDPTLVGMKWRTTATNPAPTSLPGAGAITVVETFGYDRAGNRTSVAQAVSGSVTASGTIGYAFNNLAELARIDLPPGCAVASVFYGYDDQGDVVSVGTTRGGNELGRFGFSADRQPQTWSTADWRRVMQYAGPGWVTSIVTRSTASAQSFALAMTYEPDGAMASRTATYAFPNFAHTHADQFTYDGQRRLARALGSSDTQFTQYDPNGNLWAMTRAGKTSSFACRSGADTLLSVSIDGVAQPQYVWNARGQLTSGQGRSHEYVAATGLTRAVTSASAQLALAYGGNQQRVVKQDLRTGRVTVYFHGAGQQPVAVLANGSWGVLIQGPMGPLAWIADRTHFLLNDTTRSVWGVLADGALRAATTWTPFGSASTPFGDASVVPFGYHGQEHDREVGLHNFGARLYDPALCRFLAPDPQRQFASPYVFAANNPLMVTDPDGELSTWALVGIGAAMVAVAAAGVALSLATGGSSFAAAGAANAALASSAGMTGGAATSAAGVAAGVSGTVGGGTVAAAAGASGGAMAASGAAAAAGGAAASSQVIAGVTVSAAAVKFGVTVAGSTLSGIGVSGLTYTIQHGRDFTAEGYFTAVGIGAASGFASGMLGGTLGHMTANLTASMTGARAAFAGAGIKAASGTLTGSLGADIKTVLTNTTQHRPWYHGLLESTLRGAATGAVGGGTKSLGKSAWAGRGGIAKAAVTRGIISDQKVNKLATMTELAKAAATSDQARNATIAAGVFVAAGYGVWGGVTLADD